MRFRILGPLSVTVDGQSVVITAARDRVVLVMLLLNPGRVLGVDTLIEAVWGDEPPATARSQLQNCISRLRRSLPFPAIESDPAGYQINLGPDDVDSSVFARLVAAGRRAGDPALLRQGLDLWRGDALSGVESETVRRAAVILDEQRTVALEEWAELELAAGHDRDLIAPLTRLADQHPLRERLRGQLIQALAGVGRTGDALIEFRRLRTVLRDELGLEPSPRLQELHRRILAGDTQAPAPAPVPPVEPVRSLPRTVADFTGHAQLIDRLVARAAEGGPVVLALDGMAGSGKTTVALHLAARLDERYPDAHVYIDLHGSSSREPLDVSSALTALLRALGIPAQMIPASRDERVDLWRNELARRRALVILDNAASSGQIGELLPSSPRSLTLITSRRRLLGLDGVHPESLPVLEETEAVALLARIAGDRVLAEPDAAAELVRRCGSLPLAIRLAGARLAHRPRWQVADLVKRFGDGVLPELKAESRSVAGAFALSFGPLPELTRRMFRLLGVHPGRLFDVPAAAALAGLPLGEAADLLDDLVDVHLLEEPEPKLFRMHDLLHEYASALAAELPSDERYAALHGLLDLELTAALLSLSPSRRTSTMRELGLAELPRPDLAAAVERPDQRLERGRVYLRRLLTAAIEAGRPEFSWQLARASWWRLSASGYSDDLRELLVLARAQARRAGNSAAQAMCANYLGSVYHQRARFDDALAALHEAIRLRRAIGDPLPLARVLGNLVAVYLFTDRLVEAEEVSFESLQLAERAGDEHVVALRLEARAYALARLGRYAEAIHLQRRRLLAVTSATDGMLAVPGLLNLVLIRLLAGDISPTLAERWLRVLHRRAIQVRMFEFVAEIQAELGGLLGQQGRPAEARELLTEALETFERVGDRRHISRVLNTLGSVEFREGDRAAAVTLHQRATELAKTVHQPFEVARAYVGLGDCATDPEVARSHWRAAVEIFTRLEVPERHDAAARLEVPERHDAAARPEVPERQDAAARVGAR
jgi:DNA-binding SARP family transcriptional activator/tetratricopeptide (TPR) repeat protein